MSNISNKLKAIKALEESQSFPKQSIYFEVMRYMVEEEKHERNVKSSTIAMEVLTPNDNKTGINRDAYVRAKILNLRKDLKQFYLSEGRSYDDKIIIPKGEYKLVLVSTDSSAASKVNVEKKTVKSKITPLLASSTVLLTILCLYLILSSNGLIFKQEHPASFVSLFMSPKEPLDIVFGDRGIYGEYDAELKRFRAIYDTDVSLPENHIAFDRFKNTHPERRISFGKNFYHTDIGNIFILSKLRVEWFSYGMETRLYQSTQKKEINRNTIFLSKTSSGDMYVLFSHYFTNSKANFKTGDIKHAALGSYTLADTSISFNTSVIKRGEKHYFQSFCLIKKVITDDNHELLFLLPSNDAARRYIHSKLYKTEFLQELSDSFEGDIPDEFELVLKMLGRETIIKTHKIIYNSATEKINLP